MKFFNFNSKFITAFLAVSAIFVLLASTADAQTKRRKTSGKTAKTVQKRRSLLTMPAVLPAPVNADSIPSVPFGTNATGNSPGQGDAAIVSRADDYQNSAQTLPVEPEAVQPQPSVTASPADNSESRFQEMNARIKNLESKPANEYDQKQKRLLLNLDILTRAETRAESLRKQLFDMIEKESNIKVKLEQIENDSRPENIDRSVAFAGTLRPEELRDIRAKNLESEKRNLETLLTQIQDTRANLDLNVQKADQLVDKLRSKLQQDIDDSLADEPKN